MPIAPHTDTPPRRRGRPRKNPAGSPAPDRRPDVRPPPLLASTADLSLAVKSTARSPSRHPDTVSLDESWSLTMATAEAVTGFAREAIYDLIRAGEIKSFMFGKRRYVLARSLRDYLERRAAEPLEIGIGPNSRQRLGDGTQAGSEGSASNRTSIVIRRKGRKFGV